MKIKLLCVSDSDKHFQSAIDEYLKRLGKDLEIITLKPEKNGTREQIIQKETQKIIDYCKKINPGYFNVLLVKEGKQLDTLGFADLVEKKSPVLFIIGWPYGVDENLIGNLADLKLSLGAITMPHGLAKLVLLEQIYRAGMIKGGREYHY